MWGFPRGRVTLRPHKAFRPVQSVYREEARKLNRKTRRILPAKNGSITSVECSEDVRTHENTVTRQELNKTTNVFTLSTLTSTYRSSWPHGSHADTLMRGPKSSRLNDDAVNVRLMPISISGCPSAMLGTDFSAHAMLLQLSGELRPDPDESLWHPSRSSNRAILPW